MLSLNNVKLEIQPLGSACFIFMIGEEKDIELRFNSFANHGATQLDHPDWWTPRVATFSTTTIAAQLAFVRAAFYELISNPKFLTKIENDKLSKGCKRKKIDAWDIAHAVGFNRFYRMKTVSLHRFGKNNNMYALGSSVKAEKNTGNFNDDVLGNNVTKDLRE